MSQNDFTIANQTFPNTRADINSALQALASTSSGASEPSTTFANQLWYDTSTNKLYIRNEDNDANILLLELDQTNDTVEYFSSDSVRTPLIEYTDGTDALTIGSGGELTTSSTLDVNGNELILDADADTSITADTDDRIDLRVGGTDRAYITNNTIGGIINRQNAKPLIINGDMAVAQRATSVASITAGDGYNTMDRMRTAIGTAGTFTQSQETDVPTGSGFGTSLKMDCTTANGSLSAGSFLTIQHRLEGQDLQLLKKGTASAEYVTISFWVKSAKTGTYTVELEDRDNTRHISQSYTISSANTWEKKVLSFAGDTSGTLDNDNVESLRLLYWLVAGSTYSGGTLDTSWSTMTQANRAVGNVNLADSTANDWYLTGVQLEVGQYDSTTIPPFQHESFGDNLARCQRYYQQYGAYSGTMLGYGRVLNTTNIDRWGFILPVEMRASPTGTLSGTVGLWDGSVASGATLGTNYSKTNLTQFDLTSSGTLNGTAGTIGMIFLDSSGIFALTAEL